MNPIDIRNRERRAEMGYAGALDQSTHVALNARWPGLTRQQCIACDGETGRWEDDSIYDRDENGPYCESCRAENPAAFD